MPFEKVETQVDFPAQERAVLDFWQRAGAFEALRGTPGNVFDDPCYRGAPILVAGANFGCGSSREHAVWALRQIGVEAVIAPSFGEIFEANALRNGLVPVCLPDDAVEALLELGPQQHATIDIIAELVLAPFGEISFRLEPFRRHILVQGLDEIEVTESFAAEIAAYEEKARRDRPWEQQP
jgi:3-isopropylmalate/(R)-2-methylmalate dehydratase small subunit